MLEPWLRIGDLGLAFAEPGRLALALLALALVALALVAHARRRAAWREGRLAATGGARLWAATALRSLALLCAVAALAGASLVETQREDRLTVVALRDESASISPAERGWMNERLADLVAEMWPGDEFALLAFGRDARLVVGPGAPGLEGDAGLAAVDGSATDLMSAIELGAGLASGSGGVMVLLTDGNETVGDAVAAAESARRRGVRIFPLVPPRELAPLTIERVSAPPIAREGGEVRLAVALANRGRRAYPATLVARQGDRELGRLPVVVEPGRSIVEATVEAGPPGNYAISVELEAAPGVASVHARRGTSLSVLGRARLLLVAPTDRLGGLLEQAGFAVTRRPSLGPTTAEELSRYHAVVLGAVERRDLAPASLAALEEYVRDRGGGLVLAAGRALLADPKLRGSPLERVLPLRVKKQKPRKRRRAPLALFLLIDRSSSMSYGIRLDQEKPSRIEYAREAALALLAQLEDRDRVGAAAFDTETSLLAPLAPLAQNRERLRDLIGRLVPSGGTDFKDALEMAGRQLVESGASIRHIILLSDGASIRPAREHEALIEALARSGVSVTAIRIGDDKDSFALIQSIAERTGGSFFRVVDAVSLPSLMIADTRRRAGRDEEAREREERAERPFRPRLALRGEALAGIEAADLPPLRVFADVPLKSGAEAWLTADRDGQRKAPILAAWQDGLGRVAVFTANPTAEWQSWRHARRFWAQLVRWAARPESADELRLEVRREGGQPLLSIDTYDAGIEDLEVAVMGRDGVARSLRPTALGPRHFELALPPLDRIERRVEVALLRGGAEVARVEQWLPPPASLSAAAVEDPEADPNRPLLEQVAEITGGKVGADLGSILARSPAERQVAHPLEGSLALAALALVALDIALRLARTSLAT